MEPVARFALDRIQAARRDVEEAGAYLALAQAVEADAVGYAVVRGVSWADVGRALGISRQAAHERFARRIPGSGSQGRAVRPGASAPLTAADKSSSHT
jgi:hypothetical protein